MQINHVMCPVDFSSCSSAAVAYASSLASEHQAELHLVHVYEEPFAYVEGGIVGTVPPADLEPDKKRFGEIVPTRADVRFRREFIIGNPADRLIEYARNHAVDLIVIGTHGRTGISRLLMGSVAEAVLRRAPCPVLTLKQPDKERVRNEVTELNLQTAAPQAAR
jgi:nucleotide-binding universal stress UspA family protein